MYKKRFWSRILGKQIFQLSKTSECFTQETAASRHFRQQDSSVNLRVGCTEKLLAGYTTVVGEADKHFFSHPVQ